MISDFSEKSNQLNREKLGFLARQQQINKQTIIDLEQTIRINKNIINSLFKNKLEQSTQDAQVFKTNQHLIQENNLLNQRINKLNKHNQQIRLNILMKDQIFQQQLKHLRHILSQYQIRIGQLRSKLIDKENMMADLSNQIRWDINRFQQINKFQQSKHREELLKTQAKELRLNQATIQELKKQLLQTQFQNKKILTVVRQSRCLSQLKSFLFAKRRIPSQRKNQPVAQKLDKKSIQIKRPNKLNESQLLLQTRLIANKLSQQNLIIRKKIKQLNLKNSRLIEKIQSDKIQLYHKTLKINILNKKLNSFHSKNKYKNLSQKDDMEQGDEDQLSKDQFMIQINNNSELQNSKQFLLQLSKQLNQQYQLWRLINLEYVPHKRKSLSMPSLNFYN